MLVSQLSTMAPKALEGLGKMLEQHGSLVWASIITLSGEAYCFAIECLWE